MTRHLPAIHVVGDTIVTHVRREHKTLQLHRLKYILLYYREAKIEFGDRSFSTLLRSRNKVSFGKAE
jgi:hypothetical protein